MAAIGDEEFAGRYEAVAQISGDPVNGLSVVRECSTGKLRVRKALCTADVPKSMAKILRREAELLQTLDHPCIVHLHEYIDKPTEEQSVLILEHLPGGDCSSWLEKAGDGLSEGWVAGIMRQLLQALSYCHDRGIVHRDVNPSNVVISETNAGECQGSPACKLIDFGFAGNCAGGDLRDAIGTAAYEAPELRKMNPSYNSKVDIWAAGALAFELLLGGPPFGKPSDYGGNDKPIFKRMKQYAARDNPEVEFEQVPRWRQLSAGAQSFILWLLTANPHHRPTAAEAAAHSWLQSGQP